MNFKKIISAVAAAAVAVTTMAVSAFASTVTLDSEYPGDWGSGATIAKSEFDKFDGDVKVVLTVEVVNVADDAQYVIKPMDKDKSWDAITSSLTTEKGVCKPDGWMQVKADQTEVEFVVPKAIKDDLWNAGIGFQVCNVIIKSAELSDGAPENPFTIVSDDDTTAYCNGKFEPEYATAAPADEAPADEATDDTAAAEVEDTADEEADVVDDADEADDADVADDADDVDVADDVDDADVADDAADDVDVADDAADDTAVADSATTPVQTGNASAAVILSIMAVAGAAAVVSKRK